MSKREPYIFDETFKSAKAELPPIWRSLDEKADPARKDRLAQTEFRDGTQGDSKLNDPTLVDASFLLSRRDFVSFSSLSAAAVGLAGCIRRPEERTLPYAKSPEYMVLGNANHYATVIHRGNNVLGLVVESHEGRPTKIEGNPEHPDSMGGTDLIAQAEILNLYDPDRARDAQSKDGKSKGWSAADKALSAKMTALREAQGEGLAVLVEPNRSPTQWRLIKALQAKLPKARVYAYSPIASTDEHTLIKQLTGESYTARYRLDLAKTVLSLDADLLGGTDGVRHSRGWMEQRKIAAPVTELNRLYVVESALSLTGSNADHRLLLPPNDIAAYLSALAHELHSVHHIDLSGVELPASKTPAGVPEKWVKAVAKDLVAANGFGLIAVGACQPPSVHALALALNLGLGHLNKTMLLTQAHADMPEFGTLAELVQSAKQSQVKALVMLGANPVYNAPADAEFAKLLESIPLSIHAASHINETASRSSWVFPLSHALEAWGDAVSSSGAVSIQQPLIAPLFSARSELEVLAWVTEGTWQKGHDLVRATWADLVARPLAISSEVAWQQLLQRGVIAENGKPVEKVTLNADALKTILAQATQTESKGINVVFKADRKLEDGRHANNPWLLELPDPITKISWDNAALMSPETAKALGIKSEEIIEIKGPHGKSIETVAWVTPGIAKNTIALTLGWGRKQAGRYGNGHGFDVYPLRTFANLHYGSGFSAHSTGRRYPIAQTQEHHAMEDRPIALDATLVEYQESPDFAKYRSVDPSTKPLWKEVEYNGHKWGMSIDLSACTGCNACAVACMSENNLAMVGKDQLKRGREMHWLRIDRYFVGDDETNPDLAFQPVACVQCENAPCENVCPVNATEHSPEGLNDMAYNRCIGTRYCMNNCPYKVRRFNYLDFHGDIPEVKKMQFNPSVTVRMRGVMEKCSYCVQRIEEGRAHAKREGRRIADGDITTACQQACPTQAIVFGDLNDPQSRVKSWSTRDRAYKLLADIGTKPRTTYLAKIRNPNAELTAEPKEEKG